MVHTVQPQACKGSADKMCMHRPGTSCGAHLSVEKKDSGGANEGAHSDLAALLLQVQLLA